MSHQFIKIEYEDFAKLMNEFESEINKMSILLEEVDSLTRNTNTVWDGDDSEKVMIPFTNFKKEFVEVNAENKKYLEFFQHVIDTYKIYDTSTSSNIDESASAFDFVGR